MKTKKYLKSKRKELVEDLNYFRRRMKEQELDIKFVDECLGELP